MYFPERATNNVKNRYLGILEFSRTLLICTPRYVTLTKGETVAADQLLREIPRSADELGSVGNIAPESVQGFVLSRDYFSTPDTSSYSEESTEQSSSSTIEEIPIQNTLQMDLDDYFNIEPFFENYALTSIDKRPDTSAAQSGPQLGLTQGSTENYVSENQPLASADCRVDSGSSETAVQLIDLSPHAPPQPPPKERTPQKFVISIDEPSLEMVKDIMGVLVTTKARFKSEMQHGIDRQ